MNISLRVITWIMATGLMVAGECLADAAHFELIEHAGKVELMDPSSKTWELIQPKAQFRSGMKVRSDEDSFADFSMDDYFENVFRVDETTKISLLNEHPARIALDEGTLFLLREENHSSEKDFSIPPRVRVLTKDFVAEMKHGGCVFRVTAEGVVLSVFGESVLVYLKENGGYSSQPVTINEGFKYMNQKAERMVFEDYDLWQKWYKGNDKRKDSHAGRAGS